MPKAGLSPLAPTTYEYSHLYRQRRCEAVSNGVRAKVDGRLLHPQDVDPVEERARQELASRASFGLPPCLRQVSDVADRDIGWDVVQSLTSLGRHLFLVEASHCPFESLGVTTQ